MEKYKNKAGNSGVIAFKSGPDYIQVMFAGGAVYTYNYQMPGKKHVEKMKKLATIGEGLSTYISRYVGDKYADKNSD